MARKIEVVDYCPEWKEKFWQEAAKIQEILGENCITVYHIGSTSVKGLRAKPIIDLMPVVKELEAVDLHNKEFEARGYECKGEYGILGRRFFMKGGDLRTHHVHIFAEESRKEIERHLVVRDYLRTHKKDAVRNVNFDVRAGEIVCLAGIEGNGQTELVYGLTGLEKISGGTITLDGQDITHASIRQRSKDGMSHIPEDRHKHGLVLDYTLEKNMVLQRYWQPQFQHNGFIKADEVRKYSDHLIEQYDVRSGQGSVTIARSMSGGNQQKAIIAREIDKNPKLLVAVQPTRGLDVGAIEYIHKQIVAQRDAGKAVLLVSLELDEVMNLSDRILVMYEGEIVGEFDPKTTTVQELGLYMAGARKQGKGE